MRERQLAVNLTIPKAAGTPSTNLNSQRFFGTTRKNTKRGEVKKGKAPSGEQRDAVVV